MVDVKYFEGANLPHAQRSNYVSAGSANARFSLAFEGPMRTAGEDGVKRLYHYEGFHPDRLRDILVNNRIWVSSPAAFNDPWDFRMDFDLQSLSDPKIASQQSLRFANATLRHSPHIPLSVAIQRAEYLRKNPKVMAEGAEKLSAQMEEQIAKQYRVYCTSPHPDYQLMWSHYGNKHQGICLEYSTANPVFVGALAVQYLREYPQYQMFDNPAAQDAAEEHIALTAKSDAWSYENEYRVIAQERAHATAHPTLHAEKNYLPIPADALTSIIVGCMAPKGTVSAIQSLLAETGHHARLRFAERAKARYALEISDRRRAS